MLGSDDAIVSTASLILGVAESSASKSTIVVSGVAALVAGALSMAVGEYVSVSSQADAEKADIEIEKRELAEDAAAELDELAGIYVRRGLTQELATEVARQLSEHDRLEAHLRDELGIDQASHPQPLKAAWVSAVSFATFASIPILALAIAPESIRVPLIAGLSLLSLGALGALGAHFGGASLLRGSLRVCIGGGLAMAVTALIGHVVGTALG